MSSFCQDCFLGLPRFLLLCLCPGGEVGRDLASTSIALDMCTLFSFLRLQMIGDNNPIHRNSIRRRNSSSSKGGVFVIGNFYTTVLPIMKRFNMTSPNKLLLLFEYHGSTFWRQYQCLNRLYLKAQIKLFILEICFCSLLNHTSRFTDSITL